MFIKNSRCFRVNIDALLFPSFMLQLKSPTRIRFFFHDISSPAPTGIVHNCDRMVTVYQNFSHIETLSGKYLQGAKGGNAPNEKFCMVLPLPKRAMNLEICKGKNGFCPSKVLYRQVLLPPPGACPPVMCLDQACPQVAQTV